MAKIRSSWIRKGKAFLTLLTLAWLNVVLQPCAMAMAVTCPDCPPAHVQDRMSDAAIDGHDHARVMPAEPGGHDDGAGGHETEPGTGSCAGELVECLKFEDINQTARQEQSALEPGLAWIVTAPLECRCTCDRGSSASFCAGDPVRLAGAFPPLNILYCVYLD